MTSENTMLYRAANVVGAVMVVGGGIAGIQSALDLANSGYLVYLVEKSPGIGGTMAQLDKTFPTNDCAMCILSPKLVECGRHMNIELMTLTELVGVSGEVGNFTAHLRKKPRYVDVTKCIACGLCAEKCPKKVKNEFNAGLDTRKAAYIIYGQTVPLKYAIDGDHCIYIQKGKCRACEKYCPAGAINFDDKEEMIDVHVGAVILAPGFSAYDPSGLSFYGYGDIPDVVTSLEYERILSASGPYLGHLTRPSDHAEPKKIAWLQCVGSRSQNACDNGYCSSVCCMYAIKQAVMSAEHSSGGLSQSIFFMDMRTHGKNFERGYEDAKAKGVRFLRARPHSFVPGPEGRGVSVRYVDESGREIVELFDMVILSVGLTAPKDAEALAEGAGIDLDKHRFAACSDFSPVAASRKGIYVCGAFDGPKDIPQSVVAASAAACCAGGDLAAARGALARTPEPAAAVDVTGEPPRVGVFICSCGSNIAGVVDVAAVTEYAATLPGVVFTANNMFTCSQDVQDKMAEVIREKGLNRIVVAACTPRTHEPLFQETMEAAGLNKYLFEMANIRNQASWVHGHEPDKATEKSKDLVRMAVAKALLLHPLAEPKLSINPVALVIGGGVAGMIAALELARQGFPTHIVERQAELGGNARSLSRTAKGEDIGRFLGELADKIDQDPRITVHASSEIKNSEGFVGNFKTTLATPEGETVIEHGAAVIATGARESRPTEYAYGKHPGVMTHLELERALASGAEPHCVVFIQCVGSREPDRPYCSRVCCTHAVMSAIALKEKNPHCQAAILYRDMRTYGDREELYTKARKLGVIFVRYSLDDKPRVRPKGPILEVTVKDHILDADIIFAADVVCLAAAIEPNDNAALAKMFKIPLDSDGWLFEAHQKLRPVDFATDGVFMAGMAHYPKPVEESIAQAQAAAARAVTVLSKKEITTPGAVASINAALCVGCGLCWQICPYGAIGQDDKGFATVNEVLCKGCGTCVASCRSGAPNLRGFTKTEVMAQITALL